ncbi:MAG: phosphate ABC transporter substrate-binding protein [Candidatus Omnitrophica bacterium]|nr:phosphate ABC transporter substrate-binding protein [Candidatus Omnitrophota bacterium]
MHKKIWMGMLVALAGLALTARAEDITMTGSTTVLPIAQKTAEVFMDKHPGINIAVRGGGSGVGIASIIDGTCDIGNASRPIKDKEIKNAMGKGSSPKANVVALDGIAVIVNPSNGITKLTIAQIKDIYTGKISNWSQAGGANAQIVVISRDSSSGTFETFNELALGGAKVRPDALMQASNQAVATTVAQTPAGIGYVGLGYLSSSVKAVAVDGTMPSNQTVLSQKYKLARPLFMYTNGEPKGAVKQYMDFVTGTEGQKIVEDLGFVGLK